MSLPIIGKMEKREQEIFNNVIGPFLPSKIVDFHAHIGLQEHFDKVTEHRKKENIGVAIAHHLPIRELFLVYEKLFKDKKVETVVCPFPFRECKAKEANTYVSETIRNYDDVEGFFLADPDASEEEMEEWVSQGCFRGVKPYPDRVTGISWNDIKIYDYVSSSMMTVADRHDIPIFLHVPKDMRLADPETQREIREIAAKHPNLKLVLAHIGRVHCPPKIKKGIDGVAHLQNVYVETSLTTNPNVFKHAINKFTPERIVFGTDLPASLLRCRIICDGPRRIWAVRERYPWVKEKDRKLYNEDVQSLLPLVYENLLSFKKAIEELNLDKRDVEKIFYRNANQLLGK